MDFLGEDFLLTGTLASRLFHGYAEAMPIIDFHCHIRPEDVWENKPFANLTRVWLNDGTYGDHYKWRLMRANGVPEELITGDRDDYDKFLAWAGTIERAVGNPLYEWTHLELRRFFHIDTLLTRASAPAIWEQANAVLATDAFRPRALIRGSNVEVICTTDDPASDLRYHALLRDEDAGFRMLPALRPDALLAPDRDGFADYMGRLGEATGVAIGSVAAIEAAMRQRLGFFASLGGALSDHSLETFHFTEADDATVDAILAKALAHQPLTTLEVDQYRTRLLLMLMTLNADFGWTMQFHLNSARNVNPPMFARLGPDTGYDMVGYQPDIVTHLQRLYSAATQTGAVPQTIFYSLNQNDWMGLVTLMGCFQGETRQRLQLGAGWWFCDTAETMEAQLRMFAQQSLLPNFVGMLTDSRSFLSYPRHEYFRRVLCSFLAKLADEGRAPHDEAVLGGIVQDIAYRNARDYFGFFR